MDPINFLCVIDTPRDNLWRNDFCRSVTADFRDSDIPSTEGRFRYLSFVRNAFSGTPTLVKEVLTKKDQEYNLETSDIL
jgi:proteasome activator subunit 4